MDALINGDWDQQPAESKDPYWQIKDAGIYVSMNNQVVTDAQWDRKDAQRVGLLAPLTDEQREKFRLQWQDIFNRKKQKDNPDAQLIQDTLSEVADQAALEGAVNFQFAPMKAVLDGLESILRYKNLKYGDSALNGVGVLSKASVLEKLLARADDKIARIKNSDVLRKGDCGDLIGYLVLICAHQGWNNFDDQKD